MAMTVWSLVIHSADFYKTAGCGDAVEGRGRAVDGHREGSKYRKMAMAISELTGYFHGIIHFC